MSWLSELFGDQSKGFEEYGRERDESARAYDPTIGRGEEAGQMTWEQYQHLMNNPNFIQDQVARGYEISPYQQMLLDKTQQGMQYSAAQTGMLGSGGQQRALQENLMGMSGQFMDDYINRGLQSYGMGLQGAEGLNRLGFEGLGRRSDIEREAAEGRLQAERSRGAWLGNMFGGIAGAAGAGIGALVGGPMGAKAGQAAGSALFKGGQQPPQQQQQAAQRRGSTYDLGRRY